MDVDETVLVTGGSAFSAAGCLVELLNRGYRSPNDDPWTSLAEREVRAGVGSQVDPAATV